MQNNLSISKRALWRYVNLKINRIIHHYHVFGIITILFDEMINDLKAGKKIKIFNFGTLELKTIKPRKYHDFRLKKILMSKGGKIIRFTLAKRIRNILISHLDNNLNGD